MYINPETIKANRTPFYYYDLALLENTLKELTSKSKKYGYHVHYAFKANTNQPIIDLVNEYGLGADCVSGNEVHLAVNSNFRSDQIVFAGAGKTDEEIAFALSNDIFCFNCESIQEIEVINEIAADLGKITKIAIRINPNVDAGTHKYITTGLDENKFGIGIHQLPEMLEVVANSKNVKLDGIHFHIGSQITQMYVFRELCAKINSINSWFEDQGIYLNHINVGGGLGIDYDHPELNPIPNFGEFFGLFDKFLNLKEDQQLHFELGRSVVGQCGSLLTRVLYVKDGLQTKFVICDAGMTELLRPALYQAKHRIENLSSVFTNKDKYDVVGPICESSDCFGKGLELPITKRGDAIMIQSAGAYGEVMSSQYNLRTKAKALYSERVKKSDPIAVFN